VSGPPAFTTLRVAAGGPVAELTLTRPQVLNALSPRTLEELAAAAAWLDAAEEVRVVLVRGEGRAFCAGFDLGALAGGEGAPPSPEAGAELGAAMAEAVAGMRATTVAALHGHCLGGGMVLALACDLRLAAADLRLGLPEVELGIPLAWGGVSRLVRAAGPAVAHELIITGRTLDAREAQALRLVGEVVEPARLEDAARAFAALLARRAPYLLETTKRQVAAAAEALLPAGAEGDAALLAAAIEDPGCREQMTAYLAARASRPG
jgi:enoyl-CoA hydratase/carnithine racemase